MRNSFHFNNSTFEHLKIGLFKYSFLPRQRFILVNSTLCRMLGYKSKAEFKKRKLTSLFVKAQAKKEFLQCLRKNNKISFFETIFKNNKGKRIWVAITAFLVTAADKREYLEGIIEDISAHREIMDKLSLERDFLQGLLDNIPDAIYFKDQQNRIIKVNKFYAQGMKLKPEEIIGKTDFDFFAREQAEKMFADDKHVLKTGKPIVGKVERTKLPNGTWNQVITTKIPMYGRAGKVIGTMGITRDMTAYANLEKERLAMLISTLNVLGRALEMRDPYTFSHTRRVARIAETIARKLNWDENRVLGIRLAGELHDLGKISIPLEILNRPGKLSRLEYSFIQAHVANCYRLIKDIEFPFPVAETIYQHHERLDGSGYPRKLKGRRISTEARILAISDVLEAMTHHRPYRENLGLKRAWMELHKGIKRKYDAKIVKVVSNLIKENHGKMFWLDT